MSLLLTLLYDQSLKNQGSVRKALDGLRRRLFKPPATSLRDAAPPTTAYDRLAPSGLEVRTLVSAEHGGMVHFRLPAGQTSRAVAQRQVAEIWYILNGEGRMWRKLGPEEVLRDLRPGVSLTIPAHAQFQVCNDGPTPLEAVGVTMPKWTGDTEAGIVDGRWPPTL